MLRLLFHATRREDKILAYANNINKSIADANNKLADINGDGSVNEDDVSIVRYSSHINKSTQNCTHLFKEDQI